MVVDIYYQSEVGVMNIDDVTRVSLLYDFYGRLLTERQREVMRLYHEENLSLSEIAQEFSISRQGVHDALKNAEKSLKGYEDKLGLLDKFMKSRAAIKRIDMVIDSMTESLTYDKADKKSMISDLKKVKDIIDKLEE